MTTAMVKSEVFRFDQLKNKIKEKVYSEASQLENKFHCDMVSNAFKENLEHLGLQDVLECFWSLGYRQGDGVAFFQKKGTSFTQDIIDRYASQFFSKQPRKAHLISWLFQEDYFRMEIVRHNHRYTHENSFHIEYETFLGNKTRSKIENIIQEFCEIFEVFLREQCRSFATQGYSILEHYNMEYYEREFEEQRIVFTENGQIVEHETIDNLSEVLEELYGK